MRTYIVQSGDTLGIISKKIYGTTAKWQEIYNLNKDVITNPDVLQVGWELRYQAPPEPAVPESSPTRMTEIPKTSVVKDFITKFKTSRPVQAAVALPVAALLVFSVLRRRG